MLQSSLEVRNGLTTTTKTLGGTTTQSSVTAEAGIDSFSVSPSPCANNGDGVRPNSYQFVARRSNACKGDYRFIEGDGLISDTHITGILSGLFNDIPVPPYVDSDAVNNRALTKIYDQMRSSEVNVSTTIGEGRETLQLLGAVGSSAVKLRDSIKLAQERRKRLARIPVSRRKKRRASTPASRALLKSWINPLQTVGSAVLLWNLAIDPLMKDIKNLSDHLVIHGKSPLEFHAAQARAQGKEFYPPEVVSGSKLTMIDGFKSVWHEYGLVYQIENLPDYENWRNGSSFRPSTAWQLLTLSFVVDYFVKFGSYLETLEAALLNNGTKFAYGYHTMGTKHEYRQVVQSAREIIPGTREVYSWESSLDERTKDRLVLSSFPVQSRPTIKIPTSARQLITSASLLSQLIQKRALPKSITPGVKT